MNNFLTLREYRARFPEKAIPTLSIELLEILKHRIARENATIIINKCADLRFFQFPSYLDQLRAISLLTVRAIPDTAEFTVEFWDNLDRFCTALVQYFSSGDGKRMKPLGLSGTTVGRLSGTDPRRWETTARKRGKRRRAY